MSHLARGPVGTTGIDGKAIAAGRRQRGDRSGGGRKEAAG
jgi:hypothetical protein